MSDAVELSSMIGTWVGAGIGIFALIGILGPVLVWLASRSERHQTLNAMGRDTNGYISPGWHLGPNIYLGQRIKAPDLVHSGPLPNGIFTGNFRLDTSSMKSFSTEARWVHFGALLEAYSMKFARVGNVVIHGGKTYLPMNPSWILAVGILGRYSTQRERQEGSSSKRYTLGTGLTGSYRLSIPGFRPRDSDMARSGHARFASPVNHAQTQRSMPEDTVYDDAFRASRATGRISEQPASITLYGTTGCLEYYNQEQQANSPFPTLKYHPSSASTHEKETQSDILTIKELFLLSIGLVKIRDGQYVSLADSQPGEAWADDHDGGSYSSSDTEFRIRRELYELRKSKATPRADRDRDVRIVPAGVFQLGSLEISEPVLKMSGAFLNLTLEHDCMGFTPVYNRKDIDYTHQLDGSTYVPADEKWVRVMEGCYVRKVDAQRLALALLNIPWTCKGYLIGGHGPGVAMDMIKVASLRLYPMLVRLQDKIWLLDLTEHDKERLSKSLDLVLRRLERVDVSPDFQTFRKLYDLHTTLLGMGSPDTQTITDEAVGILCITNEEFRYIVHQSIRNLKESAAVEIDLDLKSVTLKVPSAFGVRQHFQVDWDAISDTTSSTRPHETVPVKHTAIVLASLRSLVLCTMLLACSDSGPLLELVQGLDDVVYMD